MLFWIYRQIATCICLKMCGRFTLRNFEQVKAVHDIVIEPSYNISPSQEILILKESFTLIMT